MSPLYSIGTVSKITGLSTERIRSWETRYEAIVPHRTAAGRRSYTDSDITRLKLLAKAISYGHSISRIAGLSDTDLQNAISAGQSDDPFHEKTRTVEQVMASLMDMDLHECDARLATAFVNLDPWRLAEDVILPLVDEIDQASDNGGLRSSHIHFVTTILRTRLYAGIQLLQRNKDQPLVCFTAIDGERHEIDSLLACFLTRTAGLNSEIVGPNVSVADTCEIAEAVPCAAIGIGIRAPLEGRNAVAHITEVRAGLPDHVQLWVYGPRSAEARDLLRSGDITIIDSLGTFRQELDKLIVKTR